MAQNLVMRQLDERTTEQEVSLLLWSPKMDILAAAMENGDLNLYRLQWQKVWTAPRSREEEICTSLSWRPDGKLLAAGYSSGQLIIRHIESPVALHSEELDSAITSISWHERPPDFESKDDELYSSLGDQNWEFLCNLPSLSKTYSYTETGDEDVEDCRKLEDSSGVSILVVGTQNGNIYILINGFLMCTKLSMSDLLGMPGAVHSLVLATDLMTFSCVVQQKDANPRLAVVECPLLHSCQAELATLATRFTTIQGTLQYLDGTLKRIREAWENILVEMDTKLASYAEKNPPGTVAADFLELLMFGILSPQLRNFLLVDMTEKGLKRLGQSIELSYSNIQRLVLKYLLPVCQSLNFHLGEMVGLSRASHRFPVIGVKEEVVQTALHQAGRFWNKTVELQQVVDESTKNFKAFFRWLYIEILKENGSDLPEELKKVSQQEVTFIADFLSRFQNNIDEKSKTGGGLGHFYLEKVGQYFKDAELTQPPDNNSNPWCQLLTNRPELTNVPFILPVNTKTSIVQEKDLLFQAVNNIFRGMNLDLTNETLVRTNLELETGAGDRTAINNGSQQLVQPKLIHGILPQDPTRMLYWEYSLASASPSVCCLKADPDHTMVDAMFYTKDVMSLLLESNSGQQTLMQLPLVSLLPQLTRCNSSLLSSGLDEVLLMETGGRSASRDLDNIRARQFAVSGARKVSVLLYSNKKRLRIYDMEVEEEEDEETFISSGLTGTGDALSNF